MMIRIVVDHECTMPTGYLYTIVVRTSQDLSQEAISQIVRRLRELREQSAHIGEVEYLPPGLFMDKTHAFFVGIRNSASKSAVEYVKDTIEATLQPMVLQFA